MAVFSSWLLELLFFFLSLIWRVIEWDCIFHWPVSQYLFVLLQFCWWLCSNSVSIQPSTFMLFSFRFLNFSFICDHTLLAVHVFSTIVCLPRFIYIHFPAGRHDLFSWDYIFRQIIFPSLPLSLQKKIEHVRN